MRGWKTFLNEHLMFPVTSIIMSAGSYKESNTNLILEAALKMNEFGMKLRGIYQSSSSPNILSEIVTVA